MRRRALLAALVLWLLGLGTLPAAARQLIIQSFNVTVQVFPDSHIEVSETIRPRFTGRWNGIYRTIPVEYESHGFNKTFFLDLISITDEEGNSLKHEVSRERHYQKFKIWVPGAQDATRTVVLRYRIPNALLFFDEHDELYWNFTGDEWEVPIEAASAHVILPAGATGVRAIAYTGAYGSREQDADVEVTGNEVRFHMRRSLNYHEGVTGVVGWDKGLVREPGGTERGWLFLRSNWPLFVTLLVFGGMFWLWHTRGRDPDLRAVAARYEPPEGLTPGELGTLIDTRPDMRDITATLVDLAVRGFVFIEEEKESKLLGLLSDTDYIFELRKPRDEWSELKPHERELLDSVFLTRKRVELSDLENKFYQDLPGIRDRIFEQLMARRYFTARPDKVRKKYVIIAVVVGGLSLWGGGGIAGSLGQQPTAFILAGVLSAAIILAFGWFMPARTLQGTRALEGVIGFEEFLSRVEADRFERMVRTPQLFEKYLPYAMALGVERNWVRAFQDIYRQPPQWYRGTDVGSFHPSSFVNNLNRMSTRAASVMSSSPRSSGGSGFGGGGGSGGGGGGGGGGGF